MLKAERKERGWDVWGEVWGGGAAGLAKPGAHCPFVGCSENNGEESNGGGILPASRQGHFLRAPQKECFLVRCVVPAGKNGWRGSPPPLHTHTHPGRKALRLELMTIGLGGG